jgi:hypothetical protein
MVSICCSRRSNRQLSACWEYLFVGPHLSPWAQIPENVTMPCAQLIPTRQFAVPNRTSEVPSRGKSNFKALQDKLTRKVLLSDAAGRSVR